MIGPAAADMHAHVLDDFTLGGTRVLLQEVGVVTKSFNAIFSWTLHQLTPIWVSMVLTMT